MISRRILFGLAGKQRTGPDSPLLMDGSKDWQFSDPIYVQEAKTIAIRLVIASLNFFVMMIKERLAFMVLCGGRIVRRST